MGRYRKKPIEIIAHQIGADGWPDEIWEGVNDNRIRLHLQKADATRFGVAGHVEIDTREGTLRGYPGDWIIRGVQGEFYPCGEDIFAATYDPCE